MADTATLKARELGMARVAAKVAEIDEWIGSLEEEISYLSGYTGHRLVSSNPRQARIAELRLALDLAVEERAAWAGVR